MPKYIHPILRYSMHISSTVSPIHDTPSQLNRALSKHTTKFNSVDKIRKENQTMKLGSLRIVAVFIVWTGSVNASLESKTTFSTEVRCSAWCLCSRVVSSIRVWLASYYHLLGLTSRPCSSPKWTPIHISTITEHNK